MSIHRSDPRLAAVCAGAAVLYAVFVAAVFDATAEQASDAADAPAAPVPPSIAAAARLAVALLRAQQRAELPAGVADLIDRCVVNHAALFRRAHAIDAHAASATDAATVLALVRAAFNAQRAAGAAAHTFMQLVYYTILRPIEPTGDRAGPPAGERPRDKFASVPYIYMLLGKLYGVSGRRSERPMPAELFQRVERLVEAAYLELPLSERQRAAFDALHARLASVASTLELLRAV
jgi:hypothetical protein